MLSKYHPYIADKYKDTWGLNQDYKNEDPSRSSRILQIFFEEFRNRALCNLKNHFGKWLNQHLYKECIDAGLSIVSEIKECENGYEVSCFKHTEPLQDNVVVPFVLDGWSGECYIIKLNDQQDKGRFLMLLGQMLHEYGIDSEKHLERGLIDPNNRDLMFRAILVENIIGKLYNIVESVM